MATDREIKVHSLLEAAMRALLPVMGLLREARENAPGDMLTRNAFLMFVKTYDLTVESLQRNAPVQPNQGKEVKSLYNSQYDDEEGA